MNGTLTVRNGTVRGMGRFAVVVFGGRRSVTIDHVQVRDNGLGGVFIGIANLTDSEIRRNGGHGVTLDQGIVKET